MLNMIRSCRNCKRPNFDDMKKEDLIAGCSNFYLCPEHKTDDSASKPDLCSHYSFRCRFEQGADLNCER